MKRIVLLIVICLLAFLNSYIYGDVGTMPSDPTVIARLDELASQIADLQKLVADQQKTIQAQSQQINELQVIRAEKPMPVAITPGAEIPEVPGWLEGLKWGGDMRMRYEGFVNSSDGTRDQNRFRFRLRYGFEKIFSPDFKAGFRLASGSAADPTATNQSFDTLFTPKTININRAYAIYTPNDLVANFNEWSGLEVSGVEIGGGKFSNPFVVTSPMVWDHDVEPEGIYEEASLELMEGLSIYTTLGQLILEEDSTSRSDAELYAYKGGLKMDLGKITGFEDFKPNLDSSIALYDFSDYAIDSNFGSLARGNTNNDGNSAELDAQGFNVLNLYNELALEAFEWPAKLFVDYAVNLDEHDADPDDENDAWGLGIKFGKLKVQGDWEASYGYYNIEANAVVGAFSDSDFGAGHADNRGSAFKLGYQLTDYLQLAGAAYFTNGISGVQGDNDVRRFQLDLDWKF